MSVKTLTFRGRKAFAEGIIRDYGKYGKYRKVNNKWIRLKKGYPSFRKTIDYKKMKEFLNLKGYNEEFFKNKGVKHLREEVKLNFKKEYEQYGKENNRN